MVGVHRQDRIRRATRGHAAAVALLAAASLTGGCIGGGGGGGGGGGSSDPGTRFTADAGESVTLEWQPPRERSDGSAFRASELDRYEVHIGESSGSYGRTVETLAPQAEIGGLDEGTYYFAVRAVDAEGLASDFSAEAVGTIR